jgi:DEAD/DEAH box helicase domain-containing protein
MDIVYFDLETQRTFNDVGGYDKKAAMGMSLGVTYSTAEQKYEIFSEARADALVARLQKADLVVGYNTINFDYEVLMGYVAIDLAHALTSLDLLVEIEKVIGRRLKLEDVAQGSLGVGKVAGGLDAIRWYREGRFMEIAEYCCYDVKVTKLVHEYALKHGVLHYLDRFGQKQEIPLNWKK